MKEINIPIKTTADTAGVEKLKKSLDKLTNTEIVGGKNDLKKLIKSTEGIIALEKQFGLEVDGTAKKIVAQNEAIKNTSGVNAATQSVNALTEGTGNLVVKSGHAQKGMKNMGAGALQAAYFFDDLQYGMKGIMNNIPGLVMGLGGGMGLAGALSVALLAGVKLYDWMADTKAEEAKAKKMKEVSEAAREMATNVQNAANEMYSDDALSRFSRMDAEVEKGYKKWEESLARQVDLLKEKQRIESGVWSAQDEAAKDRLKISLLNKSITESEYDAGILQIEESAQMRSINQQREMDLKTEETAKDNSLSAEGRANGARDRYTQEWGEQEEIDPKAVADAFVDLRGSKQQMQIIKDGIKLAEKENREAFDLERDFMTGYLSDEGEARARAKIAKNNKYIEEQRKLSWEVGADILELQTYLDDTKTSMREKGVLTPQDEKDDAKVVGKAKEYNASMQEAKEKVAQAEEGERKAKEALADAISKFDGNEQIRKEQEEALKTKKELGQLESDKREKERKDTVNKKALDKQVAALQSRIKELEEKQKKDKEDVNKNDEQEKWKGQDAMESLMRNPQYNRELKKDNGIAANLIKMAQRAVRDEKVDEQEKKGLLEGVAKLEQAFGSKENSKLTSGVLEVVKSILGVASEDNQRLKAQNKEIEGLKKQVAAINKRR